MTYPASLDDLTTAVPSDGDAPTTALDDATYPHDDHHRALGVAVEAIETELGTDPAGSDTDVKTRLATLDTTVAAKVPKSLVDAAGDLIYGSADDTPARLGIGTAGQVLTVNSGATAPEWADAAGGGGSAGLAPIFYPARYTFVPNAQEFGLTHAAGYGYWTPFPVERDVTLDRIGVEITTAGASTVLRMGIYADDGGSPGSLVLDAGTVDASSTGWKEITISQALTAGRVWLCLAAQGSNNVTTRGNYGVLSVPFLSATGDRNGGCYYKASITGALPASAGTPDGVTGGHARWGLREST